MTVMVTGASGLVGRATVKALLARDEVRATVRRASDASYLRQLGAKVAVRDVDTPDALLVCPRDRAQDVKKLVDSLKERGNSAHV